LFRQDPTELLAPRSAWARTSDAFIGKYLISDVFAIDGRTEESFELIWDAPASERAFWQRFDGYEIRALPDFDPCTMVLISPADTRCGFYSGGCLWIDLPHRGHSMGVELVLAMADAVQDSPTAYHGGLGFTQAGWDAHYCAWLSAVTRAHDAGHHIEEGILLEAYGPSLAPPSSRENFGP
jgi:hypothetical protein